VEKSKKEAGTSAGKVTKQKNPKIPNTNKKKSLKKSSFKLNLWFSESLADKNIKKKNPAEKLTFLGVAQSYFRQQIATLNWTPIMQPKLHLDCLLLLWG
jgi:hypothetical protein